MVQPVGISNNSLLYNMGHGADHGDHSHTDHDSVFRYCCHSLEVMDEESGDDSVEGQHDQQRHCSNPHAIVIGNNTNKCEWTENDSDQQSNIQQDCTESDHIAGCQVNSG